MPASSSNLPSSFASALAAAGQNSSRDRGNGRPEGRGSGSGEWTRRDGRPNGTATLTLRRSSTTPFNQSAMHSATDNNGVPTPVDEIPASADPRLASSTGSSSRTYSREQLLEISKSDTVRHMDVNRLLMPGFNPGHANGNSGRSWGKANESNGHHDPTACWDQNGNMIPLGLQEMSQAEQELFASDINSPLKQPQNKDGGQGGALNGRKASFSHGGNFGLASPNSASRPGTKRRETTDTNPFPNTSALTSPTGGGPSRFWGLGRGRGTDTREETEEPDEEQSAREPPKPLSLGGLTRSNTSGGAGSAGFGVAPWGASPTVPGAFGSFALPTPGPNAAAAAVPAAADTRGFGSSQGGSRLAHLMPRDSSENVGGRATEGGNANATATQSWRARPRTDTDPFADEGGPSGSAALGGARDTSPPPIMSQPHGAEIYDTPAKGNTGDFGMSGLDLGATRDANGSASPSQTNPYRSPPAERGEEEHAETGYEKQHHHGIHSEQASHFGSIGRSFPTNAFEGSDRSQTSSVGAKVYPSLGNISGWPTTGLSTATPDRERVGFNPFGSSLFSPTVGGDLHSPGLGSIGGMFGPASASGFGGGTGSLRGSKLAPLFQNQDQESLGDSVSDQRQASHLGAIGRPPFGTQPRDTESPMRANRGPFDMFPSSQPTNTSGLLTSAEQTLSTPAVAGQGHFFGSANTASSGFTPLPPTGDPSQGRTMVMPDRMRWVYLDPKGQVQGPFTGLEMNDWYKAQFFSANLAVKKLEDTEFEALGMIIRRIGNSREPFLVPQIGVAHGPPSQTGPFSPSGDTRGGGVIPPLVGVVPSFGRTLTAEEQNNLERRKQEEQYMMARQREFLAQQNHRASIPASLHHQASAHSLQSQPSFGSITSPIGNMTSQPPIGAMGTSGGFFEAPSATGNQGSRLPDVLRGEVSEQDRQTLASPHGLGGMSGMFPPQPVGAPSTDLRSQLPSVDQLHNDSQGFKDRLKAFQEIQDTRAAAEAQSGPSRTGPNEEEIEDYQSRAVDVIKEMAQDAANRNEAQKAQQLQQQQLSLTQQVQQAQAAQAAAEAAEKQKAQVEEAWAKQAAASSGLPMPFPPPPLSSNTPLPAPRAQRHSNIADHYTDSRSQTETPDSTAADSATAAQPPPLAPWAQDPGTKSQKGPSLKEIQEAEAKKTARLEAARRVVMEQEAALAKEREKMAPVVPGLPTTSTWGSGSPAPVAPSPWAKPSAPKNNVPGLLTGAPGFATTSSEKKKTLAEIQREEESRKMKAAKEQAAQAAVIPGAPNFGKRYADLASKVGLPTAAAAPTTASGWNTVGAGGKVKVPTGPAAQTRTTSASNVKAAAPPVAKPATTIKPVASFASTANSDAQAEWKKWVYRELSKSLTGGSDVVNNIALVLFDAPPDPQVISDIVYSSQGTLNGNDFAAEFIRRKKLADKGIVEKQPTAASQTKAGSSAGEWSEVAKKGGGASVTGGQQSKESEVVGNFKMVPGRKKGKK